MTNRKMGFLLLVASVGLFFASAPAKAQTTATFNLTSPGSGDYLANVYTSPYGGNINGGSTIPVICDDFADDSYVPETWTAYVTQGSAVAAQPPIIVDPTLKWNGGYSVGSAIENLTQQQAYAVAAVLGTEILNLSAPVQTPTQMQEQEDLSYALWGLFDPTGTSGDPGAFAWLTSNGDTTDLSNAQGYLSAAITQVLSNPSSISADLDSLTIYSFDSTAASPNPNPSCGGSACPNSPPQEFIVINSPEPSFFLLLAVGLIFAMGAYYRKPLASMILRPVSVNR